MKIFGITRRYVFTGHRGSVYSIAGPAQQNSFITAGGDGIIALWQINGTDEGLPLANVGKVIYSVAIDSEGTRVFAGQSDGGIHVIDTDQKKELRLLQLHEGPVFNIKVFKEQDLLISLGGDGTMVVTRLSNLEPLKKLKLSEGKLRDIDVRDDIAAVGTGEGSVKIIKVPEWKVIHEFGDHQPGFSVNAITFSPDGRKLFTGSRDAHLNIHDVKEGFKLDRSIPAHNYAIYSILFHPDGSMMATCSRDKTIKLWDPETMDVLLRIDKEQHGGHLNSVNTLYWHPNGTLVSAGDDRAIMLWEF
jgi:WD40 repeat protein